eukprot:5274152-Pyramimonas_sp.AAC.1
MCERPSRQRYGTSGTHVPMVAVHVNFYLSLPLHEVLCDLHREHPDVVITAYVDNVFLVRPPAVVLPAYRDLVGQMRARLGFDSRARKCAMYSPTRDASMFPADMPGRIYPRVLRPIGPS